MLRDQQPSLLLFALGLAGLGVLSVFYRDFAMDWQPVPKGIPGRPAIAVLSGLLLLGTSAGLLFRSTISKAVRVLFVYLLCWQLLKVPALFVAPRMEAVWLGFGEIAVILAAGWMLFARFSQLDSAGFLGTITGERGVRAAKILCGLALVPIGLSHLVYPQITAGLVPAWLPFRLGWAYITGVGQIACGLGILFSVLARSAALIEAAMVAIFALLVWGPASWFAAPSLRLPVTAFFITWVIGAAAFVVGTNLRATNSWQRSNL